MQPVIVMPMHDPDGMMFPLLKAITPQLKTIFERAFVSVTRITREAQPDYIAWLKTDGFFHAVHHQTDMPVGADFLTLYVHAAAHCRPDQILHLCFIDRVAFALQSHHRATFVAAIRSVSQEHTPLILRRSRVAWATHPQNYYELEQMMTRVGELLFKKSLDFAWCHLAIQAHQLQKVAPRVQRRDLTMLAEIVLMLKADIQTKDVDWLSWEDPFLYACDPQQLKAEREQSIQETHKRLAYVIPTLQLLYEAT